MAIDVAKGNLLLASSPLEAVMIVKGNLLMHSRADPMMISKGNLLVTYALNENTRRRMSLM